MLELRRHGDRGDVCMKPTVRGIQRFENHGGAKQMQASAYFVALTLRNWFSVIAADKDTPRLASCGALDEQKVVQQRWGEGAQYTYLALRRDQPGRRARGSAAAGRREGWFGLPLEPLWPSTSFSGCCRTTSASGSMASRRKTSSMACGVGPCTSRTYRSSPRYVRARRP